MPGWQAPRGSVRHAGPRRLAVVQQNWSGEQLWATWQEPIYPPHYRDQIGGQNAQAQALLLLSRNNLRAHAPRPIPIADYTLQTRQTYVGTIGPDGRILT